MNNCSVSDNLLKKLKKLSKKDKQFYEAVLKKIEQVIDSDNLNHYKNLRYGLKNYKRVQIGYFVLVFRTIGTKIYFEDFDHHDKIYNKLPQKVL
tara:strand:+ start:784 stop:1065 length:282 start_codon:yes stop_codon:yes gene_type:complete